MPVASRAGPVKPQCLGLAPDKPRPHLPQSIPRMWSARQSGKGVSALRRVWINGLPKGGEFGYLLKSGNMVRSRMSQEAMAVIVVHILDKCSRSRAELSSEIRGSYHSVSSNVPARRVIISDDSN